MLPVLRLLLLDLVRPEQKMLLNTGGVQSDCMECPPHHGISSLEFGLGYISLLVLFGLVNCLNIYTDILGVSLVCSVYVKLV